MNYRFIIIFSVLLTVVGVLSTALVTVAVLRTYEPNEVDANVLSYLTLLAGFMVSLIAYILLPFFQKVMPYKHAAVIAVLCWSYTLTAEYVMGLHSYISIQMLVLSKVIPIYMSVAAVVIGTGLGIKLRKLMRSVPVIEKGDGVNFP